MKKALKRCYHQWDWLDDEEGKCQKCPLWRRWNDAVDDWVYFVKEKPTKKLKLVKGVWKLVSIVERKKKTRPLSSGARAGVL